VVGPGGQWALLVHPLLDRRLVDSAVKLSVGSGWRLTGSVACAGPVRPAAPGARERQLGRKRFCGAYLSV
jgi:hypothetical protein